MAQPIRFETIESIGLLDGTDRVLKLTLRDDDTIALHAEDSTGLVRLTLNVDELARIHRGIGHLLYLQAD